MIKGIVGYTAKKESRGILLVRAYADREDKAVVADWDTAVEWLTEDKGDAFHIVWDLREFADVVLSVVPEEVRESLKTNPKAFYGRAKIFYVERLLGITVKKQVKGNIYEESENNFYGIRHWVEGVDEPKSADELVNLGEQIVGALGEMGIYATKLTSPVGVLSESLERMNLPTIFSNEELDDTCDYCVPMMRNEWRSAYKVGFFEKVFAYDIRAAYPSIMAGLPNTDKCQIKHSNEYLRSDWGIMRGRVNITADISPIVFDTGQGYINPKGEWSTCMTVEEAVWLKQNGVGRFTMDDGLFFCWLSQEKPYSGVMSKLFAKRQSDNPFIQYIAKNMGQGVSGKLDQDNVDGSLGELYNPVLSCMTRSRCRLKVADFIFKNGLQNSLVAVVVDSCLSEKDIGVVDDGSMGCWRFDGEGPALVLGKGEIWRGGKKPLGISYGDALGAVRRFPSRSYYEFGDKYFDLSMMARGNDRVYEHYPEDGGEALGRVSSSKAMVLGDMR